MEPEKLLLIFKTKCFFHRKKLTVEAFAFFIDSKFQGSCMNEKEREGKGREEMLERRQRDRKRGEKRLKKQEFFFF